MILKLILQFIIGLGVGLYSYLTPGYINLSVMQLSTNRQKNILFWALILISIVEIPYAVACLSGMQWLMQQEVLLKIISWLIVVLLFVMAMLALYESKKESKQVNVDESVMDKGKYTKLFLFVVFNPFQISAWAIWGAYFIEKDWFDWSLFSITIFSLGASVGVFIILKVYAFMGRQLVTFFALQKKYISYAVAGILFVLAVVQLLRNLL
jgi:hypothetical protein